MKKLTEQNENGTIPALDIFDKVFNILHLDHKVEDFISCELHGNSVEVTTYDDDGRCHKMTITYEVGNEYDLSAVMAEQQLTGYEAGRTGDIVTLIDQMNLSEREWILIKDKYPRIINHVDMGIINRYFEFKKS